MTYQTLQDFNATGMDDVIVYVAQTVPLFVPFMLLIIYLIFTLGTYFGSRKFTGKGDIFASLTVAGFVTTALCVLMSIKEGLINNYYLLFVGTITIFSFVGLALSRE